MSALRDHSILLHIIRYCDQIEETMIRFFPVIPIAMPVACVCCR